MSTKLLLTEDDLDLMTFCLYLLDSRFSTDAAWREEINGITPGIEEQVRKLTAKLNRLPLDAPVVPQSTFARLVTRYKGTFVRTSDNPASATKGTVERSGLRLVEKDDCQDSR